MLDYLQSGRTAVITGAADGIGRAVAARLAALGMNLVLVDRNAAGLEEAAAELRGAGAADVVAETLDVADFQALCGLRDRVFDRFGEVGLLMNNAGVGGGGSALENREAWDRVLFVNLFGVLNGVQAFGPAMIAQARPAAIVNTGSKQGITTPPGDTAYNVSKAGVKALTEGLEHSLRNTQGCRVHAHLLVPGFAFTGLTRRRVSEKPPGAWSADQVAGFMLERLEAGDFYIICPDNDVTREMDNARMAWAMGDITQNRPPLSRWHPDHKDAFEAFLKARTGPA
ncbi:MAG TPA: SDR family NAD(P)-dependent oxidoreductase [Caulobacteraceae bacterium]|nr:SDR family NAD(P)-dependent oxidoreductase [Caulobacteraceae bacterium]